MVPSDPVVKTHGLLRMFLVIVAEIQAPLYFGVSNYTTAEDWYCRLDHKHKLNTLLLIELN